MKIVAATILLFLTKTASADPNIGVEMSGKTIPVPNMDAIHREHVNHRMLEVSQQCASDTDALYTNQVLSDATSAWETELEENACAPDFGSTATIECFVDSTTFSTHEAVVDACQQAGGTNILVNVMVMCDFSAQDADFNFNIDMKNIPTCFDASSCNVDNDGDLASLFGNEVEGLTQDLGECSASISEGSGALKGAGPVGDSVSSSAPSASSSAIPTSSPSAMPTSGPPTNPTGGGGKVDLTSSAYHVKASSTTLGVMSAVVVAGLSFCV